MGRLRAGTLHAGLLAMAAALLGALPGVAQTPQARPLLEELYHAQLDPALSFRVTDLSLRRDAIRLNLQHGTLMFFAPVAGRMTGAVFEGAGQVLVVPPARAERHQLAKFTGSPILAESFTSAYLRFSDDSFAELMAQIRTGRGRADHAPEMAGRWQPLMEPANRVHAVRLLLDFLQSPPLPYFYAGIQGERLGAFDVIVDDRRSEPILVGQLRTVEQQRYYNVWTSFARREGTPASGGAHAERFRIRTVIHPDRTLEAEAEVEIEVTPPGRQLLIFHLSRRLSVDEVTQLEPGSPPEASEPGRALEFIQDISLSAEEAAYRSTDFVLVLLPSDGAPPGATGRRRLRFRYRGSIIAEAGTGVMFVTARDTWYPSLEQSTPARFDLRFRYPRSLELAAGGQRIEHREEGEWKECRYEASVPLPLAGFNVGEYETRTYGDEPTQVRVHANRRLEPRLARLLGQLPELTDRPQPGDTRLTGVTGSAPMLELDRVGGQVAAAFAYFTQRFGPVPYGTLEVSPLPGRLAQGYPGLLYLSTLSYLPEADLERLGLPPAPRAHVRTLMPAHETAHQWWGNWVWTTGYRDQWLNEALASYSALLLEEHRGSDTAVPRSWLESYRETLLRPGEDGQPVEATGALSLGQRLNSSQSPDGYVAVVYNKGPWVIHMLRELLRDADSGSDERFFEVLRGITARGGSEPLTTEEFQRRLEEALPPEADVENTGRLDWFFDQWVHDTGIPHYRLEWRLVRNTGQGWQVEGSIEQSEVSDLFTMPVPVYARHGAAWSRLGTVVVTGSRVSFRLAATARPDEVALDPFGTVLFVAAGTAAR
ncbi:MAG: M1 family aminopeptidase [Candidatus Acidiferrales bacterium]